MISTFLDSGVLLTAWKGKDRARALAVMEDTEREFVTGQLVRLELIPKAVYHKQTAEARLYETHLSTVKGEEALSAELGREAIALGMKYGLAAADAINVAAAIRQGAQEFVTFEPPGKPLFRVTEIKVTALPRV
jgi:predicted nucleic acid-binding protein